MKNWCAYILKCSDNSLYTGIATDLKHRINKHNQGKGAKYTRSRLPIKLVWQKGSLTQSQARQLEAAIKKMTRKQKIQLIKQTQNPGSQTLFFPAANFKQAISTLQKIKPYLKADFALVGGIANRALFPAWAATQIHKKFNDLDLVLLSNRQNAISPKLKKKFFIMHISCQYQTYYLALVDKQTYVSIDVFACPRKLQTQQIRLGKQNFSVLTVEEIYLATLRNIFETLSRGWQLAPKHIKFQKFLEPKINYKLLEKLWPKEKSIIRFQTPEYGFENFSQYLMQIKKLKKNKKSLIKPKKLKSLSNYYPKDCVQAFGLAIEPEDIYHQVEKQKRQAMGWKTSK